MVVMMPARAHRGGRSLRASPAGAGAKLSGVHGAAAGPEHRAGAAPVRRDEVRAAALPVTTHVMAGAGDQEEVLARHRRRRGRGRAGGSGAGRRPRMAVGLEPEALPGDLRALDARDVRAELRQDRVRLPVGRQDLAHLYRSLVMGNHAAEEVYLRIADEFDCHARVHAVICMDPLHPGTILHFTAAHAAIVAESGISSIRPLTCEPLHQRPDLNFLLLANVLAKMNEARLRKVLSTE